MPTALVIEDDAALSRLLCAALEARGIEATCVSSAEVGVLELAERRFDFALVDVVLPGGSGLYVIDAIRRMDAGERPFVLLMTAGQIPVAVDRSVVKVVILKPLDVQAVAGYLAAARLPQRIPVR
jgi:two-component system, response regulator RegA